jgi:uncharacterized protein (DUF849 family)
VISRIKACLNGGRGEPHVPKTPDELAAAAVAAVAAGAEAVHLHPRGPDGRESLGPADVGAAVSAVRAAGVPAVGVSTGIWMTGGDATRRLALVRSWTVRPDFASVNVGEPGYDDLVAALTGMGVAVEAGVWSPAEADRAGAVERVLVEIIGTPGHRAVAAADAILARLDGTVPVLLHGEEEACWPLVGHAGRLGLPTRIGLEDTLVMPDGTPAPGNAELVRAALEIWRSAGR